MSTPNYERFELGGLGYADRYKLLTGAVIPRPIAWVGSLNEGGKLNLAPFSQFVIVAVSPGLLGFSIGPRAEGDKDTLLNIQRTGEFVINTVRDDMGVPVQESSREFGPEVSEAEELGLTLLPSEKIAVPRIAEANIHFECRTHQILVLGTAPNHFVIGEIVAMHVREGMVSQYKIDPKLHAPLARIGGRNYVRFGEILGV